MINPLQIRYVNSIPLEHLYAAENSNGINEISEIFISNFLCFNGIRDRIKFTKFLRFARISNVSQRENRTLLSWQWF